MKTLKERVLANLGELAPKRNEKVKIDHNHYIYASLGSDHLPKYVLVCKMDADEKSDGITLTEIVLSERVPETHHNWPLAASVLGIKGDAERPANDLLWAAWKESAYCRSEEGRTISEVAWFNAWLKGLPPDTLKEDREIVAQLIPALDDERVSLRELSALKRLCGLEVGG